jgi:hypothetical protein
MSAKGSACAEKVASSVQYGLHPSQPFPVSQAWKNSAAVSDIDAMWTSLRHPMSV